MNHTIRFQRILTVTDNEPLTVEALHEHAADAWHDDHPLWTVELDGELFPFEPPAPDVPDRQTLIALNALMDRNPAMNALVARDYALTVLYAVTGRCTDCGQELDGHDGPVCAAHRAMAGLF